ncbi:GGDEF domain-containing protein [uncultured Selenomonas sp.]|uniref:GGDEF domain-containing protein n=1 Tax=uncultured Selenomonas sp. TaxID=159275 RepID=UPI0025E3C405|nr:GGDEF domain-containing protein [uncultured Selenomonas sp.]
MNFRHLRNALLAFVAILFLIHLANPRALDALVPAPAGTLPQYLVAPPAAMSMTPAADAPKASGPSSVVRVGIVRPALDKATSDALIEQQKDYLGELSKYTGWDFYVVPVSSDDSGEALASGKFELLLPVEPHIVNAEQFAATKPLALRDVVGFYRRPDDPRYGTGINGAEVPMLQGARVAIDEGRKDLLPPFGRFCRENGIEMTLVPYASDAEARAAFARGDADLLLDTATSTSLGETLALAFDAVPMSIAARHENEALLETINEANEAIDAQNPRHHGAYQHAFGETTRRLITHFTPTEQVMIDSLPELRVVLPQDDPSIAAGRELIERLCEETGLRVTFVTASNVSEARAMLRHYTADIMPDIYTRNSRTADFYFTDPLYAEEYVLVGRSDADVPKVGTIALPVLQTGFAEAVQQKFPGWRVVPMVDEQHALAAVSNGQADLAVSSIISMQATRNLMLYPNLVLVPSLNKITIGTSLAIGRHEPRLLQAILNKAMLRLDPQACEEILLKHETRTPPHFSLTYFLAFYPLQTGLLLGTIVLLFAIGFFLRELIERRRQEAAARAALENYKYQSQTDPLTGLYNKAAAREMIEHSLLEPPAPGHCHALFMCDLDHFKAANDLCGHSFGDEILIAFAESLRSIVRSRDLIGRFGGDEFVIFLKNGTDVAIPRIAEAVGRAATLVDERLRTTNEEAQKHPDRPLITVSIGVAVPKSTEESYDTVFHKADTALYHVKEHGRAAWKRYDASLEDPDKDGERRCEPDEGR